MSETITHAFVSAKTQSPDTTLISKNEWNDGHVFSGGINGQMLIYDNTQPNNMRWVDGRTVNSASLTISGSTTTPIAGAASISKTFASENTVVIFLSVFYATSTGAAAITFDIQEDGITVGSLTFASGGPVTTVLTPSAVGAAGAHTYSLRVTTVGNVNMLTASAFLFVDAIGA